MTQADSVLSTPPPNTSASTPQSSRRGFLAQATGAVAGGAALGASLPLPARSDVTALNIDAELIELGAKFEPLLDQYYRAHRRWSRSLAQAQTEHDQECGTPAERNYEYPPEVAAAFNDSCVRSGVDETSDTLSAIDDEMKPLAKAINAAPVNSIEGLRAKAMVAFWEVAPLFAGSTEFYFEDAYPFQQLFTAVAECCGVKEKVLASGYDLPHIGVAYDTSDEGDDDGEDA
jgi:hypothetical protein